MSTQTISPIASVWDRVSLWWANKKRTAKQKLIAERVERERNAVTLAVMGDSAYISYSGVGIRQLNTNLTLAQAIAILNDMKDDTASWVKQHPNL